MKNALQVISYEPTKSNMDEIVKLYIEDSSISPLAKYLNLKGLEYMIKEALANKEFKNLVKDDYLTESNGALDKRYIMGVEIKTASQEKKNTLAKAYLYSEAVDKLEREIELMKQELKLKEDFLKGQKLYEIESGSAKLLAEKETTALDSFSLVVTFKYK